MGGGDYCVVFGCSNSRRKLDKYCFNTVGNKASGVYILFVSFYASADTIYSINGKKTAYYYRFYSLPCKQIPKFK